VSRAWNVTSERRSWTGVFLDYVQGVPPVGDEFIEWFGLEPRSVFAKATLNAWRGATRLAAWLRFDNVRIPRFASWPSRCRTTGSLAPRAGRRHHSRDVRRRRVSPEEQVVVCQAQAPLNGPEATPKKDCAGEEDGGRQALLSYSSF
jgi:hypothetical protein